MNIRSPLALPPRLKARNDPPETTYSTTIIPNLGARLSSVPEEDMELLTAPVKAQHDGPAEELTIVEPPVPFERVYLTGAKLYTALVVLIIGTFLLMLDTSVIATAIPSITDDFHSLADVGWYSGVYQLACAALQPMTGKFFSKFPLKATYITCFSIFMTGSLICGLSKTSIMFIIGRAVAGIGGAGISTGALTITATIAPPDRANVFVGIVMGFSHVGIVMGPILGGIFSTFVNWRWCFLINLPIGALMIPALVYIWLPEQCEKAPPSKVLRTLHHQLDLVGFLLLTPFTIQLLLALQYGASDEYPWTSATVIGLFCGSLGSLIAWAIWNTQLGREGILPLWILKHRVVWSALITQCLLMTSVYLVTIYLSLYFQAIQDYTPIKTGLVMIASILTQLVFTIAAGRGVVKTGLVSVFGVASAMFTVGSNAAYAQLKPDSNMAHFVAYQMFNGMGRGIGMQSQITAINMTLEPADNAVAMALMMFSQMLLTAILQVVANVIVLEKLKAGLEKFVPGADATAILAAGATNFRKVVSASDLPDVISVYNQSITYVFWLVAILGGIAICTAALMGSIKLPEAEAAEAATAAASAVPDEEQR